MYANRQTERKRASKQDLRRGKGCAKISAVKHTILAHFKLFASIMAAFILTAAG